MDKEYNFFTNIINENSVVQDKVQFFFDYVSLFSKFANLSYKFKIKSHKSLVDNIIYQLRNNYDSKKSETYIKQYLNDDYFKDEDIIFAKNNDLFKPIVTLKELICTNDNNLRSEINSLLELSEILHEKYLDKIIEYIHDYFISNEKLNINNQNYCSYLASILASEFFLISCSKKDLESIINKIIGGEFEENGAIEKHIKHADNIENYEKYYNSRDLKTQLNEIKLIYNYYKTPFKIFYFAESNAEVENPFELSIGDVSFSNEYKFEKNYMWDSIIKPELDFSKTIFISIKTTYNTDNSRTITYSKMLDAVKIFENIYEISLTILPYTISNDVDYSIGSIPRVKIDPQKALLLITKGEFDEEPFNCEGDKHIIENNDKYYFRGFYSNRIDEKLIYLWSYLESFEKKGGINKINNGTVNTVFQYIEDRNKSIFVNFLMNKYVLNFTKLTNPKDHSMLMELFKYHEFEKLLKYFKSHIKSPIFNIFLNKKDHFQKEYLKDLLLNIYEQRNMIIHGCKFNFPMVFTQVEMFKRIVNIDRIEKLKQAQILK
jgi:hypothetical protein